MAGTQYLFGDGDTHRSNTAGWPITIQPGEHRL